MPFGPFYSQEEKNKINAAQQRNSGYKPRPVRGDGEYTNKNKGRSGANQIDVTRRAQETVTPPPAPSAPPSLTSASSLVLFFVLNSSDCSPLPLPFFPDI